MPSLIFGFMKNKIEIGLIIIFKNNIIPFCQSILKKKE